MSGSEATMRSNSFEYSLSSRIILPGGSPRGPERRGETRVRAEHDRFPPRRQVRRRGVWLRPPHRARCHLVPPAENDEVDDRVVDLPVVRHVRPDRAPGDEQRRVQHRGDLPAVEHPHREEVEQVDHAPEIRERVAQLRRRLFRPAFSHPVARAVAHVRRSSEPPFSRRRRLPALALRQRDPHEVQTERADAPRERPRQRDEGVFPRRQHPRVRDVRAHQRHEHHRLERDAVPHQRDRVPGLVNHDLRHYPDAVRDAVQRRVGGGGQRQRREGGELRQLQRAQRRELVLPQEDERERERRAELSRGANQAADGAPRPAPARRDAAVRPEVPSRGRDERARDPGRRASRHLFSPFEMMRDPTRRDARRRRRERSGAPRRSDAESFERSARGERRRGRFDDGLMRARPDVQKTRGRRAGVRRGARPRRARAERARRRRPREGGAARRYSDGGEHLPGEAGRGETTQGRHRPRASSATRYGEI
eukprot:30918-Pelagococcus_subviridis.AAC.77